MDTFTIIALVVVGILVIPLMWYVHCGLERCYVWFGYRFCRKHGYIISQFRCGPEFEPSGVKTEYSLVEFDCSTPEGKRILVKLRVWVFGIKKVLSMEDFSEKERGQQNDGQISSESALSDELSS